MQKFKSGKKWKHFLNMSLKRPDGCEFVKTSMFISF